MSTALDQMLAESDLSAADASELSGLLSPLAGLMETPVPTPELEALLAAGAPLPARQTRRRSGTVAGVAVLALASVGGTGMAAAANTLPPAWQHQVAEFSETFLPFDFPEPEGRPTQPAEQAPPPMPVGEPPQSLPGQALTPRTLTTPSSSGGRTWQVQSAYVFERAGVPEDATEPGLPPKQSPPASTEPETSGGETGETVTAEPAGPAEPRGRSSFASSSTPLDEAEQGHEGDEGEAAEVETSHKPERSGIAGTGTTAPTVDESESAEEPVAVAPTDPDD